MAHIISVTQPSAVSRGVLYKKGGDTKMCLVGVVAHDFGRLKRSTQGSLRGKKYFQRPIVAAVVFCRILYYM